MNEVNCPQRSGVSLRHMKHDYPTLLDLVQHIKKYPVPKSVYPTVFGFQIERTEAMVEVRPDGSKREGLFMVEADADGFFCPVGVVYDVMMSAALSWFYRKGFRVELIPDSRSRSAGITVQINPCGSTHNRGIRFSEKNTLYALYGAIHSMTNPKPETVAPQQESTPNGESP